MASQCASQGGQTTGLAAVVRCGETFDFTLLFEQSILGLIPAAAFILAGTYRIVRLVGKSHKTVSNPSRFLKLTVAAVLAGIQLALLVLWGIDTAGQTKASLPLAVLDLIVAAQFLALTWMEDTRSVRPSSILNAYLLFTLLLDLAQARTLWLRKFNTAISGLFTARIATKASLLVLEAQSKRNYLKAVYQALPPESIGGILNRSLLWWVNGLFQRGFRSLLTIEDLYVLDRRLSSIHLRAKVQKTWDARKKPERRFEFPLVICTALWRQLLYAAVPRVFLIGFTFAQPFLISRLLNFLAGPDDQKTASLGYGLIGATALIYLGLAISSLHYNQNIYRFITMFRGATVSCIYDHLLVLPDATYDKSGALTLMDTDVERIAQVLTELNECWARSIEVIVGVTLLALQLGWVCVLPIVVVIASFYGGAHISKNIGNRQKVWVDSVQKRISITASVLAEMRSVKMMGLSNRVAALLQNHRIEETRKMAAFRWSIVWQNVVQNLPWALAPALTFTVYVAQAVAQGKESIGTTQAFTSLAIINLLTDPTAKLVSAIPSTASSVGCFDRIQKFLVTPPRVDQRVGPCIRNETSPTATSDSSTDGIELGDMATGLNSTDGAAINASNVSIRPSTSSEILLNTVSFAIPRNTLTMVVGPVASGKTTVFKAILGEIPLEGEGRLSIRDRRIAYCSQVPWLPNGSIRDTISGPTSENNPFDETWYQKCLHVCDLQHDISLLGDGDKTRLGTAGAALSGGQKHRIALARAVYSRARILLLDDVLGALDVTTQRKVFLRLFGQDGLLRGNTTVLLSTHAVDFLKYADKTLVVKDGSVAESCNAETVARNILKVESRDVQVANNTSAETVDEISEDVAKENELEDLTRSTGDLAVYKYYFRHVGWLSGSAFVGFVVIEVFGISFGQIWLKWWTEAGGGQMALYMSIYLALAAFVSCGMGGYIWTMLIRISPSTARKFHSILLNVVMRAPQSFFTKTDSGTILNRFSQDMTLIESQLATGVLITVSNLFMAIASAALVATGSTYMAASVPVLIITVWSLQHVYLRTSRQLRLLDIEAKSPLYSHFLESLSGLITIRAFGWETQFQNKNAALLDTSQRPYYLLYCVQRWLTLVLDLIVGAEAVLVVGLAVGLRNSTTPGLLGVSLNNILSFSASLSSLLSGWTMLETSLGSIARLKSFEKAIQPEDKPEEKQIPPANWPENGAIELRNVTASHSPGAIGIHNLSLHIKPGQKIGICGRTASGKSSLISTILRLLELDSGTLLIDGTDITTIPREIIRQRLIVVPQDPVILAGSLRLNVDPDTQSTDADIRSTLERVGLTDLLKRTQLDDEISASSLSRGEQQLLAMATALVKRPHGGRIVLLDEATSNLDGDRDAAVQKLLRQEFGGCTMVVVAHRLDTILDSDVIVVMDEGRVVEVGDPGELLDRRGWLSRLVNDRS